MTKYAHCTCMESSVNTNIFKEYIHRNSLLTLSLSVIQILYFQLFDSKGIYCCDFLYGFPLELGVWLSCFRVSDKHA